MIFAITSWFVPILENLTATQLPGEGRTDYKLELERVLSFFHLFNRRQLHPVKFDYFHMATFWVAEPIVSRATNAVE